MSGKVGAPDLLVLFTGTMSHKMLKGKKKTGGRA